MLALYWFLFGKDNEGTGICFPNQHRCVTHLYRIVIAAAVSILLNMLLVTDK
jgi:hypothetical protein